MTNEVGARGKCLLIDLGGGSCEVTLSDRGSIKAMVSLPLGAVRLQEQFLQGDPPAKEDVARLKQFIERELRRVDKKLGKARGWVGDRDLGDRGGAGRGQRICEEGQDSSQEAYVLSGFSDGLYGGCSAAG